MDSLWFRRFHGSPHARARLICFAHAGGAASYFHPLSALLAPAIEVAAVQYPGRQDRRSEPLVDDLHVLADRIATMLAPSMDDVPTAFFGHSMGATLAHETALRLRERDAVTHLVVSGRRAPTTARVETVHLRDDPGIIAEVTAMSGTDASVLADPEVRAMVLPALRNDYRAVETYRHRSDPPLPCPITVLLGQDDPKVSLDEARLWQRHTTASFDLHVFPGGHFYLADHAQAVADVLTSTPALSGAERTS